MKIDNSSQNMTLKWDSLIIFNQFECLKELSIKSKVGRYATTLLIEFPKR